MIAARTDEKLRATLQNVLEQYSAKVYDAARGLPGAESFPEFRRADYREPMLACGLRAKPQSNRLAA
jgi:hypothetical protein